MPAINPQKALFRPQTNKKPCCLDFQSPTPTSQIRLFVKYIRKLRIVDCKLSSKEWVSLLQCMIWSMQTLVSLDFVTPTIWICCYTLRFWNAGIGTWQLCADNQNWSFSHLFSIVTWANILCVPLLAAKLLSTPNVLYIRSPNHAWHPVIPGWSVVERSLRTWN